MIVTRGLGGRGSLVAFGLGLRPFLQAAKRRYVSARVAVGRAAAQLPSALVSALADPATVRSCMTEALPVSARTADYICSVVDRREVVRRSTPAARYNAVTYTPHVSVKARRT